MINIATISQKGGTGKTAASLCLASYWASKKKKVLVVDLDPQKNSTLALGITNPETSISDLLNGKESAINTPYGIDLIAGDSTAYLTEKISPTSLKSRFAGYDVVIMDCPPALNNLTLAAVVAANIVLVPLLADTFSLQGLTELQINLNDIKKLNPDFQAMAFFNRSAKTSLSKQLQPLFSEFCKENGIILLRAKIRQTIAISESAAVATPLFDYAGRFSNATADFTALAREIEKERNKTK